MARRNQDLEELLKTYREADIARRGADEDFQQAKKALIKEMQASGQRTASCRVVFDGYIDRFTATLVEGERVTIDEDRLKKEVGATQFNKVCTLKLDKTKLEDAIARGVVDPVKVAMCSETIPISPYIKSNEKREFSRKAVKRQ